MCRDKSASNCSSLVPARRCNVKSLKVVTQFLSHLSSPHCIQNVYFVRAAAFLSLSLYFSFHLSLSEARLCNQ